MNKFSMPIGAGLLSIILGCQTSETKPFREQKAEIQDNYKTLKGKIVGYSRTKKEEPWYFILEIDKEQQPFEIQFTNEKEYERIVRILERGNHVEVDVDKNKYLPRTFEQVPSEKIRQGTVQSEPDSEGHRKGEPETSSIDPALEQLVKETLRPEKITEQTTTEYVNIEGTVIGRTYYKFEQDENSYLFAIQTANGIKTIETTIKNSFEAEVMDIFAQPGNEIQIQVDKDKINDALYKLLPERIGLRVVPVMKEGEK